MAQVYGRLDSEFLSGHPMSSESSAPSTLQDFIHCYGAMEGLKSDNAKSETFIAIKDIFVCIRLRIGSPNHITQHQNPIERRIQDLKHM